MNIAFYAPLKSPNHPVPSGDRRMARLLMAALRHAGHDVCLVSELRAYDGKGDGSVQVEIRDASMREVERIRDAVDKGQIPKPDLCFTYHVYYKAPDWIGPAIASHFSVPYVTAEASYAEKRRVGPWQYNDPGVRRALLEARLHFCLTRADRPGLSKLLGSETRLVSLPPFLDRLPELDGTVPRAIRRQNLLQLCAMSDTGPIILAVGMMRPGDRESYRMMARVLGGLQDRPWSLVIVGDGPARDDVQQAFSQLSPDRIRFVGAKSEDELGAFYGGADIYFWPAVNEAYGMAFLEAQACGLPVVSRSVRGVPDVVLNGQTGILTPESDEEALMQALDRLIGDRQLREEMGQNASGFVSGERTLAAAARRLDEDLRQALSEQA